MRCSVRRFPGDVAAPELTALLVGERVSSVLLGPGTLLGVKAADG